jgi:hypothetical protein
MVLEEKEEEENREKRKLKLEERERERERERESVCFGLKIKANRGALNRLVARGKE